MKPPRSIVFITFSIAVTVVLAAIAVHAAAEDEEVVLVQVTHRHGARTARIAGDPSTPAYRSLETLVAGTLGYDTLTDEGKAMLESLGNFLRARYATNTATPASLSGAPAAKPSAAFSEFADGRYHMRRHYARSTQVPRTMQSADAVIRGIVQNLTDVYPVVHTVEDSRDTLLNTVNALSMTIPMETGLDACMNAVPASWAAAQGVSPADLRRIASEIGIPADYGGVECTSLEAGSPLAQWMNCTHTLWGATECYVAQGRASEVPTGIKFFDQMGEFQKLQRKCAYANVSKNQGAISYELVDQMVGNMMSRLNELGFAPEGQTVTAVPATETNHTTLIYHYSGHDTNVAPLAVAFGHADLLLPQFGQAIITELVFDKSKAASTQPLQDAFFVRNWYGAPITMAPPVPKGTPPSPSQYPYRFTPMSVLCMDDIGNLINSTNKCSLYMFNNYVKEQLKPADPAGATCYIEKSMLQSFGCQDAGPLPNKSSICAQYRSLCPAYACYDKDYIVSLDEGMNLTCTPTSHKFDVSLATLNGAMFGTMIGGALIGAVIALCLHLFESKKQLSSP